MTSPGWPLGEGGTRVEDRMGTEGQSEWCLSTQELSSPWPAGSSSLGSLGY